MLSGVDPENDPLNYTVVSGPDDGVLSGVAPNFTYTPNTGFSGTDSFAFAVSDAEYTSASATVSIEVSPAPNEPPVASGQSLQTPFETALAVMLSGVDPENDSLNYAITVGPVNGALSGVIPDLLYIPNADFSGDDSFSFSVSDGEFTSAPAMVSIDVRPTPIFLVWDPPQENEDGSPLTDLAGHRIHYGTTSMVYDVVVDLGMEASFDLSSLPVGPVYYLAATSYDGAGNESVYSMEFVWDSTAVPVTNQPPVAVDQLNLATAYQTAGVITLAGIDPENDLLSFEVVTNPILGILSGVAPDLIYTPNAGASGLDSFTFTVSDGEFISSPATVNVDVLPAPNEPPVASEQSLQTPFETALSVILSGVDPENDPLNYTVVSGPDDGVLSGVAPNLTYSPNTDFSGADSFTFTVSDAEYSSASATVSIEVLPAPRAITVSLVSIASEDGWVRESGENSNVGGDASSNSSGSQAIRMGDDKADQQYKSILSFDTSVIPVGLTIQSALLELTRGGTKGGDPFQTHGDLLVDMTAGTFGNVDLEPSDFQASATHPLITTIPEQGAIFSTYLVDLTAAISAINPNGRTQIRLAFTDDDNDNRIRDYAGFFPSDNVNEARHPRLVVTYLDSDAPAARPAPEPALVDPTLDTDLDGIPDYWEDLASLDKNDPSDAFLDPDADRHSSLEEYALRTDPFDPDDVFKPEFGQSLNDFCLRFTLRRDANYIIQGSDDLINWVPLLEREGVANEIIEFVDTTTANSSRRMYRVLIDP
jgi:hypothetical protein